METKTKTITVNAEAYDVFEHHFGDYKGAISRLKDICINYAAWVDVEESEVVRMMQLDIYTLKIIADLFEETK